MTQPTDCQIIGRWRIIEADLWDKDYLDLVEPASITFNTDGRGELTFGAINAGMALKYSKTIIFFRWQGCDEGTEVAGSGTAELNDDGMLEIELSFDDGDEAILKAEKMRS